MLKDVTTGQVLVNKTSERQLLELGGADTSQKLTPQQLSTAVSSAIDTLEAMGQVELLTRLYNRMRAVRPELPSVEQLRQQAEEEETPNPPVPKKPALVRVK